jgi:hypothetical protein
MGVLSLSLTHRPVWLRAGLAWICAASVLDLALTLWGLEQELIAEANPLMAWLLAMSPTLAILVKLAATGAGAWALHWVYPRRPGLVAASVALVGLGLLAILRLHLAWAAGV